MLSNKLSAKKAQALARLLSLNSAAQQKEKANQAKITQVFKRLVMSQTQKVRLSVAKLKSSKDDQKRTDEQNNGKLVSVFSKATSRLMSKYLDRLREHARKARDFD